MNAVKGFATKAFRLLDGLLEAAEESKRQSNGLGVRVSRAHRAFASVSRSLATTTPRWGYIGERSRGVVGEGSKP